MQKIVVDNNTNEVLQIINLDIDTRWDDRWYPSCYVIDDVNNEINSYNLKYNKETEEFEINSDYVEVETIIEPTQIELLEQENQQLRSELDLIKKHLGLI